MPKYEFAQLHYRKEDWMVRQYVMRARFAADYAQNARRILDIASGSGYCTYHLARANPQAKVIGVDISEDALEYAGSTYQAPNLKFEQGNAFNMNYSDGFFDLVVSYETLEHVIDGSGLIKELSRITSPAGVLLCSTPNHKYDFPNKEHIKLYLPNELFDMLRCYFDKVDERYQFQKKADRQEELRKMRKRWIQAVTSLPMRVACYLTPVLLKEKIKRALGWELDKQKLRRFTISEDQVYPEEAVTTETHRPGACPFILVAVCRRRKVECSQCSPANRIDKSKE